MNRVKKILLSLAVAFAFVITLASCSKVSQSYADKINEAAKTDEKITYEDAKSALGDELLIDIAGQMIAVKGLTKDNYKEKLENADENTKFSVIMVNTLLGNCVSATYGEFTVKDVKAKLGVE